jgi:adenylylsulfate kinase-like enzyme
MPCDFLNMTKVFWLFGRSGAGKTTLGKRLHQALLGRKLPVFFLDGDDLRSGLSSDLAFTPEGRLENHRRIAELAKLAVDQHLNAVVATMAPQYGHRDIVERVLGGRLVWIYVHAPLEACIQRDPKGLYRRALAGRLDNLLDFPFDAPRRREREHSVDTVAQNVESASQSILELVQATLSDFAI